MNPTEKPEIASVHKFPPGCNPYLELARYCRGCGGVGGDMIYLHFFAVKKSGIQAMEDSSVPLGIDKSLF